MDSRSEPQDDSCTSEESLPSSPDDSKTETADILSTAKIPDYGSTTPVLRDKSGEPCSVPTWGLIFYVMAFFGFLCAATFRESLTVAIVAMVNQTDRDVRMSNLSHQYLCPRDPELDYEEGEFNWNRLQESIVLSAYFYGRGVTQVRVGQYGCAKRVIFPPSHSCLLCLQWMSGVV